MNEYKLSVQSTVVIGGDDHGRVVELCTSSYKPGNIDSILSAINNCACEIERIKPFGNIRFEGTTIVLTRPDGTIVDQINGGDILITKQVIATMSIL